MNTIEKTFFGETNLALKDVNKRNVVRFERDKETKMLHKMRIKL